MTVQNAGQTCSSATIVATKFGLVRQESWTTDIVSMLAISKFSLNIEKKASQNQKQKKKKKKGMT